MTRVRGLLVDRGSLAVVVFVATIVSLSLLAPLAHAADEPSGDDAIATFASHMSAGRWGDAWALLSDVDQAVLAKGAWITRYESLAKLPFIAVVLRSARANGGKLVAIDWTYTRYAAGVVLSDAALTAALPHTTYAVRSLGGKVGLGLGKLETAMRAAAQARGASVGVGRGESDYFVRAAPLRARCGRGQRFLLVRVLGDGIDERVALDCSTTKPDDPPLWATEIDAKTMRRITLRAEVEAALPRHFPHPFAAPLAELASHPALPIVP